MKEKTLLKIAIIGALVGIFVLFIIAESIKIDETSISKISGDDIGKDIKVTGVVKSVFNGEKSAMITITKPEEMQTSRFSRKKRLVFILRWDTTPILEMKPHYQEK